MTHRPVPDARPDGQSSLALAARLDRPSPLTDETALAGLFALTGPEGAARLLAQIGTDLAEVRHAMQQALAATDRDGVRHATHVLISLAGTIGAPSLHQGAVALNNAAHGPDWDAVLRLAPAIADGLDALIDDLARRRIGGAA